MSAVVALCAGASVMAQVNDLAPDPGAIAPARQIRVGPESLGDPVAGPFNIGVGGSIPRGVVHAFGHYWITASRGSGSSTHAIWKFDENGTFIQGFDQHVASWQSASLGYRDGASDEGANQLYFGWDRGGFAVHDYDPSTGALSGNCAQHIPKIPFAIGALARSPRGTLITKISNLPVIEFDGRGTIINTWPDPGFLPVGCAYDAASNTYWWSVRLGVIVETDANMVLTGRSFDGTASFTSFRRPAGLDIYADSRSATGDAFVMVGQGRINEIAAYEAPAGASARISTGRIGCDVPPPPTPPLWPCSLETIFATNSFGDVGGIVYMDVTIGGEDLLIRGLELNTSLSGQEPFQIEMWTRPGGYVGGECNVAQWTLVAIGEGRGEGVDELSRVIFSTPPTLNAAETIGVALVAVGADHQYTIGNGSNQNYSDGFMSLRLGAADDVPFSQCAPFSPRVWNGRFYYVPASGCPACDICACNLDPDPACNLYDFLAFQTGFVTGDPCLINLDITTGYDVADVFDFLAFQNQFVAGCP